MMKFALIFLSLMIAPLADAAEHGEDAHMHMMDMDGMEDQSCCTQVCDCPDILNNISFYPPVFFDVFGSRLVSQRILRAGEIFNSESSDVGHGPPRPFS